MRLNNNIILLLTMVLCFTAGACKQSNAAKEESKPSLVFNSLDEVRAHVTENLAQPIPEDYKIPEYISSGQKLEEVYQVLASRYPGFYGKEGNEYLQAIMDDPDGYVQMTLESKAIRRYYDPQSKY